MKKIGLSILMLIAFSQSAFADKMRLGIVCDNDSTKIGVTIGSSIFHEADASVSDEDLMTKENENPEGVVSYDHATQIFSVDNRMGCVPLSYQSTTDAKGAPVMIWTNLEDGSKGPMACHWFAYR